ncbi:MAG TPA: hypothetical protein VLA80_15365, partial [Actinomycetota bacterium]|nr:hypothetical protein [Actinomycetota bacterium]
MDLVAALLLGWLIGWVMGPILVRGAGVGLRPEWFALVPIPPGRLAAGLLGAAFAGMAPAVTLIAFAVLPLTAAQFGVLPVLVAVPAMLLSAWARLLPVSPAGAVVAKELHTWRRDPGRSLLLLLALLISGLNLAVPAVAVQLPAALPWVGPAAALIVAMGAANLSGDDGTALWLTRMVPGVERADVRGRQAAWLLMVAPVMVVLTVSLTAVSGLGWAWPWVLATLPALLGATAGLGVLVSATNPVRQKDPHRRSGPFDTGDDPNAAGAVIGQQYLLLILAALAAVPGAALVLLGGLRDQPLLEAAGVVVGVATGVLLSWWGGHLAARRLADRGAAVMDVLHLGPQGLVPIVFTLFSVDPEVRVWFAARYLPQGQQLLA